MKANETVADVVRAADATLEAAIKQKSAVNAAALRFARRWSSATNFSVATTTNKLRLCTLARKADEATQAALAEPARNCDRYATAKDALDAFIREKEIKEEDVDNMNLRDFFVWLFNTAEGGAE